MLRYGLEGSELRRNDVFRGCRIGYRYVLIFSLHLVSTLFCLPAWAENLVAVQASSGFYWLDPRISSASLAGIPGSGVDISSDVKPGITLSFHVSPHLAIEMLLSPPFELDLLGTGSTASLGTVARFKSWGPVAIAQWRFGSDDQIFRPFAGIGVTYAAFFSEEASSSLENLAGGPVKLSFRNAWSPVWQLGVEAQLSRSWRAAVSASLLDPDTKVHFSGEGRSITQKIGIDAWVVSLSVGYKF